MSARIVAVDHFAGTGWSVACRWLGIREYGVEIMPEAIRTRRAVGFRTIYRDVWSGLQHPSLVPLHDLYIASPPCQTFSVAGRGTGRNALDMVMALVDSGAWKNPANLRATGADLGDDRTALVLTPLAHIWAHRPRLVALEQVPTVLPVWEAMAEVLRGLGYSVWTGNLQAEQYGVPQTRKRAILMARLDGPVTAPTPTHSRYYSREPMRLDPGVQKWVSMAEALGWGGERRGLNDRPSPTITGGGTETGGAEPIAKIARYTGLSSWEGGTARLDPSEAATLQTFPAIDVRPELEAWQWFDAPATTVAGDPRITAREHHFHGEQSKTSLKLEPAEAARFQTFPAPFPFQGSKGKQFLQIGNAVPPLLASAILQALVAAPSPSIDNAAIELEGVLV